MKYIFSIMLFLLAFVAFPQEPILDDISPPGIDVIMDVEDYLIVSDVMVVESEWTAFHYVDAELADVFILKNEANASIHGQLIILQTSPGIRLVALPNQNHLNIVRIIGRLYPIQDSREGLFSKQAGKFFYSISNINFMLRC